MLGKRPLSQSTCPDSPPSVGKGKLEAPDVDSKISSSSSYEVCKSSSGEYFSVYLMNSDCGANHNKFYIMQLLKMKNSKDGKCWLHTRYGRVGDPGVQGMNFCNNEAAGEKAYMKTYKQKTSKAKNYTPIEMKLGSKDTNIKVDITTEEKEQNFRPSKLDKPVQDLINFIFDKKLMEASVTSVGYDPSKLPLGELSEENVKIGYENLRLIEDILGKVRDNKTTLAKEKQNLT